MGVVLNDILEFGEEKKIMEKIMEKKIGLKAMIEQQNKKKWGFEQTVDQELIEE